MTRRHMEMLGEGSRRSPEVEEDFKRFTGVCKRGVQGLAKVFARAWSRRTRMDQGRTWFAFFGNRWWRFCRLEKVFVAIRAYLSPQNLVGSMAKRCQYIWNDRGAMLDKWCTSWLRARVCSSENEKALWPFQFAYLIHGNSSSCLYSPRWRNSSIDSLISFVAFLRTAFAETLHFQDNFCHGLTSDQCVTNIIFNKPAPPKSRNVPTNPRNIKKTWRSNIGSIRHDTQNNNPKMELGRDS